MRKLRILGVIGLIFGILMLLVGLGIGFLTLIVVVTFAGGHSNLAVWLPTIMILTLAIALIVLSIVAIIKGKKHEK